MSNFTTTWSQGTLKVTYDTGDIAYFYDVPEGIQAALELVEAPGTFFNRFISGKFKSRMVVDLVMLCLDERQHLLPQVRALTVVQVLSQRRSAERRSAKLRLAELRLAE